jgi:hypothetical protein
MKRKLVRTFQLAALALTAFGATMTVKVPEANAVVYCAAGVYRAGCVARPVAAPTVNGVARRTARRTVSTLNDGSRQPSRTLPDDTCRPGCGDPIGLTPWERSHPCLASHTWCHRRVI